MPRKGGAGRQKLPMEKMKKKSNLQVTFSKRSSGAFKKANELSTLTGAKTAVIIFSPGGKPHSYGHPNLDSVVDRFLNGNQAVDPPLGSSTAEDDLTQQIIRDHQRDNQDRLNAELDRLVTLVGNEKRRGQALEEVRKASETQNLNWWERPIDELDLQQLEQLKVSMEQVKSNTEYLAAAMQETVDNDQIWPVILPPNSPVNPTAQPGNGERADPNKAPAFDPTA